MTSVSRNSAASWVVKALVEATPISGPARVMKRSAHSRTMADSGTLQMASVLSWPSALGVAQGGQGVGGFAGLRDGDDQLARIGHRNTVAVFAGDFDVARHAGNGFEPVAGGVAGVAAGAAGEDEDGVDVLQEVGSFGAEDAGLDGLAAADDFEGVGQRFRLLEDFLLHVVLVVAEFDGGGGELRDMDGAADRGAVEAGDLDTGCGQLGDVAVFQVDHVAGDLEQCRGVGGGVVAGVGDAEQQRRAFAGDDDLAGLLVVDDGDGVGADQSLAGELHRLEEIRFVLERGLDQVGDAFGVGVRGEDVALGSQFAAQAFVVLDDAVVDDGDAAGDVRVGVAFGGHAVGGPAGVGDAGGGGGAGRGGFEFGDATDRAHTLDAVAADDGNAGRVIAPVFEFLEAFDEDGNNVAGGGAAATMPHMTDP
jgi:hypothetical protein